MSLNIPTSQSLPRVIIVGGGFAGINLVQRINSSAYEVVLIDKNNHHTFQPLLYQVATAGLEAGSIAYPLRKIMRRKKKNFYFRMTEVLKVNPEKNTLSTSAGEINYDYLVLATGSETNYFGMKDVEENSAPLKSVSEAIDLRHIILQNFEKAVETDSDADKERLMTFVLAGAGPTGVELSGALCELKKKVLPDDYPELDFSKMKVILVDPGSRVLAAMSASSSERAKNDLEKMGVSVRLNVGVKEYDAKTVTLTTGENIASECLIWSAGVQGALVNGFDASIITKGNRYVVDEYNRVQGYDNIFAVGDIAMQQDKEFEKGLPMVAAVAIQQGSFLAKNLNRKAINKAMLPFKYFNKGGLATIGRQKAVADLPGNIHLGGIFAWVTWLFVHLLYLVGFRNKVMVISDWIWSYFTFDRRVRLIIRPFDRKNK